MSRRAWRGIRTPKYEQPARVVMTSSCFHSTSGQAEGDPTLDDEEEDDDRDRDQRRRRHDGPPVDEAVAAVQEREPDGDRLLRAVVKKGAREDVLVPARDEREHRGRDETRRHERQEDADESAEPCRAV